MKYLKIRLLQYLTKNLLKMVTEDEILRITSEGFMVNKRKLEVDEIHALRAEAREFKESMVWKFMCNELEYVAFVRGRKSTTDMDNYGTHAMFYNLDLMQKFLDNLSK